jgi:hypothetical protein
MYSFLGGAGQRGHASASLSWPMRKKAKERRALGVFVCARQLIEKKNRHLSRVLKAQLK